MEESPKQQETLVAYRAAMMNQLEWRGPEEGVPLYKAIDEAISLIPNISEVERIEISTFIDNVYEELHHIFRIRFGSSSFSEIPIYHGLTHAEWALVHGIRAYVGAMLKDRQFNRSEFNLMVVACAFHEVDDWWNRSTPTDIKHTLQVELMSFLQVHHVDIDDFNRVLKLDDFSLSLEEAVGVYLCKWDIQPGDRYYEYFDGRKGERLEPFINIEGHEKVIPLDLDRKPDMDKAVSLVFIGEILGWADFAQCLDAEYLKEVSVEYTDPYTRENRSVVLRNGPYELAKEHFALRKKALIGCGWGTEEYIDFAVVGSDSYFLETILRSRLIPAMKYIDRFYDVRGRRNPYAEQLIVFEHSVRETESRRISVDSYRESMLGKGYKGG